MEILASPRYNLHITSAQKLHRDTATLNHGSQDTASQPRDNVSQQTFTALQHKLKTKLITDSIMDFTPETT